MEKFGSITALLVDCVNIAYDLQAQELKRTEFKNLSISEVHVLEAIVLENKPTMSKVAARLKITLGSLSTAVNKLIEKKMVERVRSQADKRIVYLALTHAGKQVLEIHESIHAKIDTVVLGCIPEDKRQWVFERIKEITRELQQLGNR